jgi:hypothetical protein
MPVTLPPHVQLLGSQASLSPSAETRFLAFRLLSTLVLGTEKEEIQLMIIKDLIEDCPYPQMRVAGISLLREVVAHKMSLQTVEDSAVSVAQHRCPDA